jgi:hypothetical protein
LNDLLLILIVFHLFFSLLLGPRRIFIFTLTPALYL